MLMLATANSGGITPRQRLQFRLKFAFSAAVRSSLAVGWMMMLISRAVLADDESTPDQSANNPKFAQRAETVFKAAKTRFESDTNNPEAQWQFGRACYDWADFSTSDHQRENIATQGIAACSKLIKRNTDSAPGHYYLAMNLGQLAQTKTLGALKLVSQMEAEFKFALGLDPKMDYAGPDRGLGLLYLEAPGWPASIGNKSKAREHLQKAMKLFPKFPENVLNMLEAELKWGEKHDASRDLAALNELWPSARKELAGDEWGASWADWDRRRQLAEKKLAGTRKTAAASQKTGQDQALK